MTTEQKLREALADVMAQGCGQPKSCGHEFHCICPGDAARTALSLPPSETREEFRVSFESLEFFPERWEPGYIIHASKSQAEWLAVNRAKQHLYYRNVRTESRTVNTSPWDEVPAGIHPSPQAECAALLGQCMDKLIDAAPVESPKFKPGDIVTHFTGKWGSDTQVIDRIDSEAFPDDPVAFFVGGGFWVTSRLRRVATICAFQGSKDAPCQKCGKSWMAPEHQAPMFDPRTPR